MASREMVIQCGPKCRSKKHAEELVRAVTRGNLRQIQLFLSQCHNAETLSDVFGRTVLHMAASCGKPTAVDWLLTDKMADPNAKDKESGWTALHRALFYGQLASARLLISLGASLKTRDHEGLTALALAMKDRLPHVEFENSGLYEAFTWGDNANFTLGHDTEQRKKSPESVELFRKLSLSIKQVVMCKYHSVFLTAGGQVYTCGHGRGGRLGHGTELTCLEPKQVSMKDEVCTQVTASKDHTVLLMESGNIYSCGLNDFHQLGQHPAPSHCLEPKQMNGKVLKGKLFTGVLALRYHTVLYNTDVLFTFGLNAGQLGHQKNSSERVVSNPRQVSALMHKDMHIKLVAASDAATVVVTNKGDIYALHEYQCRKIVSKHLDIEQIGVTGGNLDHHSDQDNLREHGGSDLNVSHRTTSGKIYLWRSSDQTLRRCGWLMHRQLFVTDMALNLASIAFITKDGEAFMASLPKRRTKSLLQTNASPKDTVASSSTPLFSATITDLVERDEVEDFDIERIPVIHRAVGVASDSKGRNFGVLQAQPNSCLTEIPGVSPTQNGAQFCQLMDEADMMDLIHDVILQVGEEEIPAHKYILAFRSEYFLKYFAENSENGAISGCEKPVVHIDNVDTDLFRQLLKFIYTDSCDLLVVGTKYVMPSQSHKSSGEDSAFIPETLLQDGHKVSAFSVHQTGKSAKSKKKSGAKQKPTESQGRNDFKNPIKVLQDLSKRFGIKQLSKRLESVKYANGSVERVAGRTVPAAKLRFFRHKLPDLYDVCIKTEDGKVIPCHKCVLVARLEYFRSMMASGWVETSSSSALSMPVPSDILEVVIDYLYQDDSTAVRDCMDAEFMCNVLVLADQLLIERLKEICEVTITGLITLKNACELLEFASMYNARQLRTTCQQFVTINLTALLETRSLDVLSDDVIEELSVYYKDTIPGMERRRITPDAGWPDIAYLEHLEAEHTDTVVESDNLLPRVERVSKKNRGKKKRLRTKSAGEDAHEKKAESSNMSQGSTEQHMSTSLETSFEMELHDIRENGSLLNGTEDGTWTTIKVRVPAAMPKASPSPHHTVSNLENVAHRSEGDATKLTTSQNLSTREVLRVAEDVMASATTDGHQPDFSSEVQMSSSPVEFRSIMAEQECFTNVKQKPSTQTTAKKSGRLSQRERKRLLSAPSVTDEDVTTPSSPTSQDSAAAGAKPKAWASPTNAWGAVSSVVQSFKDLMMTEETHTKSEPVVAMVTDRHANCSSPPADKHVSWGLPSTGSRRPKPVSTQATTPTSPGATTTENPWQRVVPTSPVPIATKHAPNFSQIMKDERQQKETLDRVAKKPLALIQIEEQAILELLTHYGADRALDEYITVERVHTTLARPTWAATQRPRES